MKRIMRIVALGALCILLAFGASACGEEVKLTLDGDGYLTVNGDRTDIKIGSDGAGQDGEDGEDGTDGKSAYELYKDANPQYKGSEAQWLEDMAAGKLANKREYDIISYGRHVAAAVKSGTASSDGSSVNLNGAVLDLYEPVVLPLGSGASWHIDLRGILTPGGSGGGQILTSFSGTEGRFYLGINTGNNILFWGVLIDGFYANYCFDVSADIMREKHDYRFGYGDGEFSLSIDGAEPLRLTKLNVNQTNVTAGTSEKLSAELVSKVRAATGQNFAVIRHIGADSHKVTASFDYIKATTSSIYGYEKFAAHPLADKTVYYLGSSVTYGEDGAQRGVAFAEKLAALTGGKYVKETVSGTTLAVVGGRTNSYAERMENLDFTKKPDALVVQLSSNDFSQNISEGSVGGFAGYDKSTITGAIEYIVSEVNKRSPGTRVILYTCPLTQSYAAYKKYGDYVRDTVPQLAAKWQNLDVLDIYNADYVKVGAYLQNDGLHPYKMGYAQLFVPQLANLLMQLL